MRRLSISLWLLLACGGDDAADPEPSEPASSLDAGAPEALKDAAPKPRATQLDGSTELVARLQANGSNAECGQCAVLVAQASGGQEPYRYEWSDSTLQGPGPHKVCPSAPTSYSVTVSDSSAIVGGEFARPAASEQLFAELQCKPPSDAGSGDYLSGCHVPSEMPGIQCPANDTNMSWFSVQSPLPAPLQIGKSYQLSYDQLLLTLGEPVRVDVFGTVADCEPLELLGQLSLDGRWHQAVCFTPVREYTGIVVRIYVGFTLFYLDLVQAVATVCADCDAK